MIFVNFKAYSEATGENAVKLASILSSVSRAKNIPIIPVVQAIDVATVKNNTDLMPWIESVDAVEVGAHTGALPPQIAYASGAKGTFLNHSEKKIDIGEITALVALCRDIGLKTLIFAADVAELERVVSLKPDYVSYEPPELVGSTSVSVSQAHPEIIQKAVEIANKENVPLIVGAGIHSKEDVEVAIKLGAKGIAVATYVVKAVDPKEAIETLCDGFFS